MKIYTRHGDKGETSLLGKSRVKKDDKRIEAIGNADELNSVIGILIAHTVSFKSSKKQKLIEFLSKIQMDLFEIGSELASGGSYAIITNKDVEDMESKIDEIGDEISPLTAFILPGGMLASSFAHFTRTVTRRFERSLVALSIDKTVRAVVLKYCNRLSDYFFVLGRYFNCLANVPDALWEKRKSE